MSKGGIGMITVFDIATEEELKEMFCIDGEAFDQEDRELELSHMERNPDHNNAMLALLYAGREDTKKSEEHIALIKDSLHRQAILQTIYERTE
jgi:hypothetical protein